MEKRRFAARDVVNGKELDRTTVSWPEDHGGYYVLRLEVASDRIVTRLHDGARWVVLDR